MSDAHSRTFKPAKYLQAGNNFMATTKFYLDTRATAKGKSAPLKLAITKNGKTALLHLNISLLPEQWEKKTGKIINHPNKMFLNTYITRRKLDADSELLKLIESGEYAKMKALDIKNHIERIFKGEPEEESIPVDRLFSYRLKKFAGNKNFRPGFTARNNRSLYWKTCFKWRRYYC